MLFYVNYSKRCTCYPLLALSLLILPTYSLASSKFRLNNKTPKNNHLNNIKTSLKEQIHLSYASNTLIVTFWIMPKTMTARSELRPSVIIHEMPHFLIFFT